MPAPEAIFDLVIIGGGPAGATAALHAARRGLSVIVLEKDHHPRFHIGESLLPRNFTLLRELGLLQRLESVPHVEKFGASFVMGDGETPTDFWFAEGPRGEDSQTISIARAPFDRMLIGAARESGAEVMENTQVRSIDKLGDDGVVLTTSAGPIRGRVLIDASGQGTVVGRHLGTRAVLPDLRRVAYYSHFTGVQRRPGRLGGSPIIVMCDEGWFWVIPLDHTSTSVGLVVAAEVIKSAAVQPDQALSWGLSRSPFMCSIMADAVGPERNYVTADFSHRCEPFAGPGYFLVGDAATFVDPIFSTGVCMGMMSAVRAVDAAAGIIARPDAAARLRRDYIAYVDGSSGVFFKLVRRFYTHAFREMFLRGSGPLGVHRAVLSLLAGHVFPRPAFRLRWRLALFEMLMRIHENGRTLVPRRRSFSLLDSAPPPPLAATDAETVSGVGTVSAV